MYSITVFGTGSRGNSALVSDGETKILIDAGVRLDIVQRATSLFEIAALLITHEHGDHAEYAHICSERYSMPVYTTAGTIKKLDIPEWRKNIIHYGKAFPLGGTLTITPFPLSHDATEPCGFYIKNALGETLVWASDTGTMEGLEMAHPADCYVLEANYDEAEIDRKLEANELPYAGLHGRLTSEFGHLSVQQAAAWLKENAGDNSNFIVLSPHPEIFNGNFHLFNGIYVEFPMKFPWSYEFGKKCPF